MNKKKLVLSHMINFLFERRFSSLMSVIVIITVLSLSQGCATLTQDATLTGEFNNEDSVKTPPLPVYYDFDDISVPPELKLDKKRSFIYESRKTRSGVLVFRGRIDVTSLASFFKENMPHDGWVFINCYKYKDYILNFQKDGKSCLISLHDKLLNTIVEIRVGAFHEDIEEPE